MATDRPLYEERTPWPAWVGVIFWGVVTVTAAAMVAGLDTSLPALARGAIATLIVAGAFGARAALGGLTVRIFETGIRLQLGSLPVLKRLIPFEEILSVESVDYRPMREFGGWGVRGNETRQAWTARGDKAVRLELTDGRELLIGSDRPQRLADRIRAAAGDRLAWSSRPSALQGGGARRR